MVEELPLPTYEGLLTEAIRSLAVDAGIVTSAAAAGTNVLNDDTKNWAATIHKNRLVKVIRGAGAGQQVVIDSNGPKSLVLKQPWVEALDTTSVYVILDVASVLSENAQNTESITALDAVATCTGATRDCQYFATFCVSCFADQAGTLFVENSVDGTTWRRHDTVAVAASTPVNRVYAVTLRYNRVVYTNGGVAQTVFELVTVQRPIG